VSDIGKPAIMTDQAGSRPAEAHERPLTYDRAWAEYTIVTALARHDELVSRSVNARAVTRLRERGQFDPNNAGHQLLAASGPLTGAERLELIATGEVIARHYRHPSDLDHAVRSGATWEQIGAARGESTEQVRREYREWADAQHDMWAGTGVWKGEPGHRFGMNDADYADAMRYASVLAERERQAGETARAEPRRHTGMVSEADAAGIPLPGDPRPQAQAGFEAGQ
jgi:hypothetical protein